MSWRALREAQRAGMLKAPTCPHSVCSQHFIDTGEALCIEKPYVVLDAKGAYVKGYACPVDASRALRQQPKGSQMVRTSDGVRLAWVPGSKLVAREFGEE